METSVEEKISERIEQSGRKAFCVKDFIDLADTETVLCILKNLTQN